MMDREELEKQMRLMSEPIDFEQLERDGIFRKVGAWYEVPDMSRLPDHVAAQVIGVSGSTKGDQLPRVQFKRGARK